jgi:selenocysteine lyase/cysteine desulfurase
MARGDVVEERARHERISLRGGCFCNPGASEAAFGFIAVRSAACIEETRRAGRNLAEFSARMRASRASHAVGAVRASVGVPTNVADVDRLIGFVGEFQNCH